MAYSKKNCSLEILQKILKQKWPGYMAIGNQPQFTNTLICRIEKDDTLTPVQKYDNNYQAFQALITKGWNPETGDPETVASLFGTEALKIRETNIKYAKKLMELLSSANELGKIYGITVKTELDQARKIYKKINLC